MLDPEAVGCVEGGTEVVCASGGANVEDAVAESPSPSPSATMPAAPSPAGPNPSAVEGTVSTKTIPSRELATLIFSLYFPVIIENAAVD